MSQLNPYKSTGVAESESPETASRRLSVLWWLVYFYPVIVLALVYASWIVACVSLGRPPGFGEHPEIQPAHAAFHVLANSTAILLLCCFLLVPSGMVWKRFAWGQVRFSVFKLSHAMITRSKTENLT